MQGDVEFGPQQRERGAQLVAFTLTGGFEARQHLVQRVAEAGEFIVAVIRHGQSEAGGTVRQTRCTPAVVLNRIECGACGACGAVADI